MINIVLFFFEKLKSRLLGGFFWSMVLRARHGLRRRPHASHSIQKRCGTSICIKNEVNRPNSRRGPSLLWPDTPIRITKWRKSNTDRPCPHTATRPKLSGKRWIRSQDWCLCAATGTIHLIIDANTNATSILDRSGVPETATEAVASPQGPAEPCSRTPPACTSQKNKTYI